MGRDRTKERLTGHLLAAHRSLPLSTPLVTRLRPSVTRRDALRAVHGRKRDGPGNEREVRETALLGLFVSRFPVPSLSPSSPNPSARRAPPPDPWEEGGTEKQTKKQELYEVNQSERNPKGMKIILFFISWFVRSFHSLTSPYHYPPEAGVSEA